MVVVEVAGLDAVVVEVAGLVALVVVVLVAGLDAVAALVFGEGEVDCPKATAAVATTRVTDLRNVVSSFMRRFWPAQGYTVKHARTH